MNASNITSGLTLTGAAQDASSVTVTLDDGDSATQPVTATASADTRLGRAVLLGELHPRTGCRD